MAQRKFSMLVKGKSIADSDWSAPLFEYKKHRTPAAQKHYVIWNNELNKEAGVK